MAHTSQVHGSGSNRVTLFVRSVRRAVKAIAFVLAVGFTWLQIKDFHVEGVIDGANPDLTRKIVLAIYYWCWVFGCNFDLDMQELAYFEGTRRLKLSLTAIGLLIIFGLVAAMLLWISGSDQGFAAVLALFLALNIMGFLYILRVVKPIIRSSCEKYTQEQHYLDVVQLEIVSGYMLGRWQWLRFGVGFVVILAMELICFSPQLRGISAQFLSGITHAADSPQAFYALLPSAIFVVFVAVMEGWIWTMRFRAKISLDFVEILGGRYLVVPGRSERSRAGLDAKRGRVRRGLQNRNAAT